VVAVRQHEFRATVGLDPSARADAVHRLLEITGTQCVFHPSGAGWFPAAICVRRSPPQGRQAGTVARVQLRAGEAGAFFATGQPFTLSADAIVDDETIRGKVLTGDGVITGREPEVPQTGSVRAAPRPARLTPPHGWPLPRTEPAA
jgi:hypothetical protein